MVESVQRLRQSLGASSTKERQGGLKTFQERIGEEEISESDLELVVELLFATYERYRDRESRLAVQQSFHAVFEHSDNSFVNFVSLLKAECAKSAIAPANGFVLTEWASLGLQQCAAHTSLWTKTGKDLIHATAQIIEFTLSSRGKESVLQSSIVVTRRALRRLFRNPDIGNDAVDQVVTQLSQKGSSNIKAAVLLGVVAGVASRLPERKPLVEAKKDEYLAFWIREVISSRALVPKHISASFADFFVTFVDEQDVQLSLVPAVEKALLRAPEVVLDDVLCQTLLSLSPTIDLTGVLAKHLLKLMLSNLKSSNESIRNGVIDTFARLITRCRDESGLKTISQDLLNPLASIKVTPADQRALLARLIGFLPSLASHSGNLSDSLSEIAGREPNENALAAEVLALAHHSYYESDSTHAVRSQKAINAFAKGLSDKKPAVQKIWALSAGNLFLQMHRDPSPGVSVTKLVEALLPSFFGLYKEVVSNPLPAAQSGLVAAAYVPISLYDFFEASIKDTAIKETLRKTKVFDSAVQGVSSKPSILLSNKVYSRITDSEDLAWLIRALRSCTIMLQKRDCPIDVRKGWAQAFIHLVSTPSIPAASRRNAAASLTDAYLEHPRKVSAVIIDGLWDWLCDTKLQNNDSNETPSIQNVVNAISPPALLTSNNRAVKVGDLNEQLIEMLVLCRPELLPSTRWIDLCIRTGQDPGTLVRSHCSECLAQINQIHAEQRLRVIGQPLDKAVSTAFAELAFVAPETATSQLIQQVIHDLSTDDLQQFSSMDFAIARTPEGVAFVDVLSSKKNQDLLLDKNSKDYNTLKWEEDVRRQLVQKKGQPQVKLSADDQAKIKAQLAKEVVIREKVLKVEERIHRGIRLVLGLANGPPTTDAEAWLGPCIKSLLNVIGCGVGLLAGNFANEAYLACAQWVSSRLGLHRQFIGVATLRAIGASELPKNLEEEPLGDSVTRILYRLRLAGEQRPFDSTSLCYMLPLISAVIQKNGIGATDEDGADEQVTLALEFISFHTDAVSQVSVARGDVLTILTKALQDYPQHYKVIKDCLLDTCRAMGQSMTPAEIQVLLHGSIVPQIQARSVVLQAIKADVDLTYLDFCEEIWLAYHDDVEANAELAQAIWEENSLQAEAEHAESVLKYLEDKDQQLRRAASRALAACVVLDHTTFSKVLAQLQALYTEKAKPRLPERDEFGMIKKTDLSDPWEARNGVALAFKELAPLFDADSLVSSMQFLIVTSAVGDRHAGVRDSMIDSATSILALHGSEKLEELMTLFEGTLAASEGTSQSSDSVSEAVVILYGALARHLPNGDDRIEKVIQRLFATLSTPSETVQFAVAGCLPPLVRASEAKTSEYVQQTLDQLYHAKKFAARRGAAYGLAGIVRGKGIAALRQYRIMSSLKAAIDNKKDANQRQGALMAYELLSLILGRVFEPYILQILPQLLSTFGDANADVREACSDAAKTCFASLSSYGVKLVLPQLLEGLDEQQWRSKKAACELLGAMANLSPQQLAISLPQIIPPLTNVLNDSHKEVRASANRSLQRFGEVISNPEVKGLVGILLKALSDPTKYTDGALDALIKVSFVHYLDAPSLALVVRILERGLVDRSATKRKSSQIIGSLAHLTERRDLVSHLPILVTGLKGAVVDPVPTTRATASKALGSLVEKLGEEALPDLIPGLMSTLRADTGAGDRLGSAQALSEVLAGLGTGRLEETLPSILQNVSSSRASVREGFMSLFIFLPACFGNSFATYLSRIIPPILAGLADEVESIRETSLRAGRLLVKNFATKSIDLLLPELDRGLSDDSHRIRLSSVELVGDLLFNLTGISATADQDDESDAGAAEAGQSLLEVLGEEKRNRILSSLYICRCDTSGLVRTAAINVWKALVATPRTLKELVPTLTQQIIRRLASSNPEQKVIAGNALGELIRKAGDGVLASLLPTLEDGLQTSTDTDNKQGICIALREIISSAAAEVVEDYEKTLVAVLRTALVDSDSEVRETAAEAFDALQQVIGKRAVDQVLPPLLNLLRSEDDAPVALSALLTLLTDNARSNIILPNLVPTLISSPISAFNARAISSLAEVAGTAMTRRLPVILNSLMDNLVACKDEPLRGDLESAFNAVLGSVDEFDGLNTAMSVVLALMKHNDHRRRALVDRRLSGFFAETELDFSRYYPDLIRVLLISFDDRDSDVVQAAWTALSELTKRLKKEEMESLVASTRQSLQQVGTAGHGLPGFSLPKGLNAILPIFLQGLMNGSAEQRIQSTLAISDMISRTSKDGLKPFATQMAGPLIRVATERSVDLKCAIVLTLNQLLEEIPLAVKPFLPQLQRIFARSLAETSSELLRTRAAKALGTLIALTPRVDPLISELIAGTKTPDDGVRNAMLKALYEVVSKAGANMGEASKASILTAIDHDSAGAGDPALAMSSARLLGALVSNLPASDAKALIKQRVLTSEFSHSSILCLNAVLASSPSSLTTPFLQDTIAAICHGVAHPEPFIADNAILAAGKYLLAAGAGTPFETGKTLFEAVAAILPPGHPVDARRLALVVVRTVTRRHGDVVRPHLALLAPPVFAGVRDPAIPVKLAAEAAFLALFAVVAAESALFDRYMAGSGVEGLNAVTKRSMQDYFRRVALRLGAQARERSEAEGGRGGLGLSGDEVEDEREIWSVGQVELGEGGVGGGEE